MLLTPEEIIERINEIKAHEKALGKLGNDLWEEKDLLRNAYKSITGLEI